MGEPKTRVLGRHADNELLTAVVVGMVANDHLGITSRYQQRIEHLLDIARPISAENRYRQSSVLTHEAKRTLSAGCSSVAQERML